MKIQFLTVAAAALMAAPTLHAQATTGSAPAHSQMQMHAGARREHHRMMKDLGLTADQKARMKAIHAKYAPQMKAAFAGAKPDMDAMRAARKSGDTAAMTAARAKMRADMAPNQKIREQEMAEMREVLTPAQQQKFEAHRAQMKARDGKRGHGGWMGKHAAKAPTPGATK
jgi:Spy/CpxP family protein refolding chaperone